MSGPVTKERLSKFVYLETEYYNQLDRLCRLENDTRLPAMKDGDGSQRSLLKSSRMENAAIRKMEQEKKIQSRIDELETELAEIQDAVDSLPDPIHREVLRLRYIDCETLRHTRWNDVAVRLYGNDDEKNLVALWRIHNAALEVLERETK